MTTPIELLREATKAVPAVKYALGIGGVLAVVALVYSFKIDPRVAFVGTIVVLVLMGVLVVFARMAALSGARLHYPVLVFTWFVLSLFMATTISLFASVFFKAPVDLQYWITGGGTAHESTDERIAANAQRLSSALSSERILALTDLSKIDLTSESKAESLVRLLENHIARRAADRRTDNSNDVRAELSSAFRALGHALRQSDQRGFNYQRPEFSQLDASMLDLSGVYLAKAKFTDSKLVDALLDRATLAHVRMVGVQASGISAQHADLSSAVLQQTCAEEANLEYADLREAVLRSSDLNNSNLSRANLTSAVVDNSRLSLASLKEANLSKIDLSGALEMTESQIAQGINSATARVPNPVFRKSNLTICGE